MTSSSSRFQVAGELGRVGQGRILHALAETAAHRPAPSLPLPIIMGYDAGPIAVLLPGPYEPCVAAMGKAGGQTFVMY